MNCIDYQDWLQQRLDGAGVVEDTELLQHLAECADCRDTHAAAQRLMDGLHSLPWPAPSADLTQRVVSRVMIDKRRRQVQRVLAIAAVLMLAVLGGIYGLRRDNNAPGELGAFA